MGRCRELMIKNGRRCAEWSRGEEGKEVEFNKRKGNGLKQRWITSTWQGSRPKRIRLGSYIYLKGARAETDEETNQAGAMLK